MAAVPKASLCVGLGSAGIVGYLVYCAFRDRTKLRGPPNKSFIFGCFGSLYSSPHVIALLQEWADEYGSVYYRPGPMGSGDVIVMDPVAVHHVFKSELVYHIHDFSRTNMQHIIGHKALIALDGEKHSQMRKLVAPGFTNSKVREYTQLFHDCANKLVAGWEKKMGRSDECEVDVEFWANAHTLDVMGLAGFGHDFRALAGDDSPVFNTLRGLEAAPKGFMDLISFVAHVGLGLSKLPLTDRQRAMQQLRVVSGTFAKGLMTKMRHGEKTDHLMIATLMSAEQTRGGVKLDEEDYVAQIRGVIAGGYETSAATLTWAMIELCRHQDLQDRLRQEIMSLFSQTDPTFDDLGKYMPLLDAVVHEVLRLHPAIPDTWRTATQDDILPLAAPVVLSDGTTTDRVLIKKGTRVIVPIITINRSPAIWGEDAWTFRPDRWLDEGSTGNMPGYRKLLNFLDGPRSCLGRAIAVTSLKASLIAILRKFRLELPNGPTTPITTVATIVVRPKAEREDGCAVPMKIHKINT